MSEIKYPEYVCLICNTKSDSSEDNILRFGEWHTLGDISVHNFCLYFTCYLIQCAKNPLLDSETSIYENEIDGENIFGFLLQDIQARVKKNKRNKCRYCKKHGAATWCADQKCRIVFHFDCGQQNDVQYQFYGSFNALCSKHYDLTEENKCNEEMGNCWICEERIEEYHKLNSIQSCCKKNWYHRNCVKKVAYYQGYDMKCLSCGTKKGSPEEFLAECDKNVLRMPRKEYIRFLEHRGIFVPKRMAIWELEPNAYAELLPCNLRLVCEANKCLCEKGRDFSEEIGAWEMIKCITCGGHGIHFDCCDTPECGYICKVCHIVSLPSDLHKTLSQSFATAEPIPHSQSPEPVLDASIRYVRKGITAYEAKWNQLKRDGDGADSDNEWYNVDVDCFEGKRKTLVVRSSNERIDPSKAITDAEYYEMRQKMRKERLNGFFDTAQFRKTPITYMPALDQIQLILAKKAEKKERCRIEEAEFE